jgi:hypothetical protein
MAAMPIEKHRKIELLKKARAGELAALKIQNEARTI